MALLRNDHALVQLMDACDWEGATKHVRELPTIFSLVLMGAPQASLSSSSTSLWLLAREEQIVQWVLERAYRGPSCSRKDHCPQTSKKTPDGKPRVLFPPIEFVQQLTAHIPVAKGGGAGGAGVGAGAGGTDKTVEEKKESGACKKEEEDNDKNKSTDAWEVHPTNKLTPLHMLCEKHHYQDGTSLPLIRLLLDRFPHYVQTYNTSAGLPLHVAARHHSPPIPDLLRTLWQAFPPSAAISMHLHTSPATLRLRDGAGGNLALHMVCQQVVVVAASPEDDEDAGNKEDDSAPLQGRASSSSSPSSLQRRPPPVARAEQDGDFNAMEVDADDADADDHDVDFWLDMGDDNVEVEEVMVEHIDDDDNNNDINNDLTRFCESSRATKQRRAQEQQEQELAVKELIQCYPEACGVANAAGNTPLHVLLSKLSTGTTLPFPCASMSTCRMVQTMVEAHPPVLTLSGEHGRLPLHLECFCNRRANVIELLLDAANAEKQASAHDDFGNLPLHLLLTPPFGSEVTSSSLSSLSSSPLEHPHDGSLLQYATRRLVEAYPAALHLGTQVSSLTMLGDFDRHAMNDADADDDDDDDDEVERHGRHGRRRYGHHGHWMEMEMPLAAFMGMTTTTTTTTTTSSCSAMSHRSKTPLHKAIYGAWRAAQEHGARARQRRRLVHQELPVPPQLVAMFARGGAPPAALVPPGNHHHDLVAFWNHVAADMGIPATTTTVEEANYHLLLKEPQVQAVLCAHPEAMYQMYFDGNSGAPVAVSTNFWYNQNNLQDNTRKRKKKKKRRKPPAPFVKDEAMVDFATSAHVVAFLQMAYPEYSSHSFGGGGSGGSGSGGGGMLLLSSKTPRIASASAAPVAAAAASSSSSSSLSLSLFAPPLPPPLPPLHAACQYAAFPEMTFFLRAHCQLNPIGICLPESHGGNLPLHVACAALPCCCLEVLDFLLERNAPALHCLNKRGCLPVHVAFLCHGSALSADVEKGEQDGHLCKKQSPRNDSNTNNTMSVLFRLLRETPHVLEHYSGGICLKGA